jgi:hypothetical protein
MVGGSAFQPLKSGKKADAASFRERVPIPALPGKARLSSTGNEQHQE